MSDKYEDLIGKKIESFNLSNDNERMTLFLDTGIAELNTYGDCCSETWIESIDNPEALDGKILSIENIEMPHLGNIPTKKKEFVDHVEYYGLKIITEKGHCVIDYRNDSNGYYGGSIEVEYSEKENV